MPRVAWSQGCRCAFDAALLQLLLRVCSESKIRHLILFHKPLHVRNAKFSPGCLEPSGLTFFSSFPISGDFLPPPLPLPQHQKTPHD